MGLSGRIFVGLIAGICTGVFFGELVADLKLVGDIFVKLLQITVLPYIVVSLIAGFGRMHMQQARRLAVRGGAVLLLIWLLALLMVFFAAQAFPDLEAAAFFGSSNAVEHQSPDFFELYLPANIFYSLSHNLVPAVVLFSILVGVALISVEDKQSVLPIFDGLTVAMARINGAIVQLTPYGIFAIAAAAAGTMTIEEVGRVQVYLVTYISLALFITFWVFPGLVAAISEISYREVLRTFRDPLVTAFATGNQFVVLPLIAENCKELLQRHGLRSDETDSAVDIIVPVSFNFPSLGKLLVLLFVLFAAWFTDADLSIGEQFSLAFNGLVQLVWQHQCRGALPAAIVAYSCGHVSVIPGDRYCCGSFWCHVGGPAHCGAQCYRCIGVGRAGSAESARHSAILCYYLCLSVRSGACAEDIFYDFRTGAASS